MLSYSDAFFEISVWQIFRSNRAMTMQMKTVFRVVILATTVTAGMFVALQAQEKTTEPKPAAPEKSTKESRAAVQEALAPFNSLIGGWRGSGQVRR